MFQRRQDTRSACRPAAAADGAAAAAPNPTSQAAAALANLADARQAPTQTQAALLLDAIQRPNAPPALLLPALALLARWARQQALQPADGRDTQLLQRACTASQDLLGGIDAAAAPDQAALAASCLLLLSGVAAAAAQPGMDEQAAEAVGTMLLSGRLGRPSPTTMSDAMAAVGLLLPCLEVRSVVVIHVLQLLAVCSQATQQHHAPYRCAPH